MSLYIVGSVLAIIEYRKYVKLEKYAKENGFDLYKLRLKYAGYVVAILFSWLAFSALSKMQPTKEEMDELQKMRK